MNIKIFITALFGFAFSFVTYSQVFSGVLICPQNPNHLIRSASYAQAQQAMRLHLCNAHKMYCPTTTTTTYYNPPTIKTQQQIWEEAEKKRKEAENKDLQEAAETANDEGMEYYERKDWATAINYFKVALEYVPDFEDAIYNLKKANEKLESERQRLEEEERQRKLEEEEKIQKQLAESIQTVTLPPALSKYMEEADKIIVPPPTWESMMEEKVTQIRLGQNGQNNLTIANNMLLAAFDVVNTTADKDFRVKMLLILGKVIVKSTNAAMDEAEIVIFKQTAWYERTLQVLKDPQKAPLLIAAIKALREKKPMPPGVTPEIEKMARATQDPALGNSTAQLTMDPIFSKEAGAALIQTVKMETISVLFDEIKDKAGKYIGERVPKLKEVNEAVTKLANFINVSEKELGPVSKDQWPSIKTMIQNKINELEKIIQPIKPIPEAILNVMSFFDVAKTADN